MDNMGCDVWYRGPRWIVPISRQFGILGFEKLKSILYKNCHLSYFERFEKPEEARHSIQDVRVKLKFAKSIEDFSLEHSRMDHG